MSESIFTGVFYLLGAIGFAGLTTLWIRIAQLVRRGYAARLWSPVLAERLSTIARSVAIAAILVPWFAIARRVMRCLLDYPCGPNRAQGWIALAVFGAVYAVFEIIWVATRVRRG